MKDFAVLKAYFAEKANTVVKCGVILMLHQMPNSKWVGSTLFGAHFVYQPIVRIENGEIFYFEQLMRLSAQDQSDVSVEQTIAALEASGDIVDFDLQAIRTAMNMMAVSANLRLGVNVSGATLSDKYACRQLVGMMKNHPDIAGRLTIEITETHSISNLLYAAEIIAFLQEYNVMVALDDLGKGNSTALYLSVLTPAIVKVDAGPTGFAVEEALNWSKLAKQSGALTVMEGVETAEQSARLSAPWVDMQQGYYFGRPGPLPESIFTALPTVVNG